MLYYYRIDISEVIDVNNTDESKECNINIYHYWLFLDKGFKLQLYIYSECHDLLMMFINLDDIAILNIHGVDYRCNITGISKSEAESLLQNADLSQKSATFIKHKNSCSHTKWAKKL